MNAEKVFETIWVIYLILSLIFIIQILIWNDLYLLISFLLILVCFSYLIYIIIKMLKEGHYINKTADRQGGKENETNISTARRCYPK